jgi:hypothetical protein
MRAASDGPEGIRLHSVNVTWRPARAGRIAWAHGYSRRLSQHHEADPGRQHRHRGAGSPKRPGVRQGQDPQRDSRRVQAGGTRYVIRYRDRSGRPQWESCRTYDEARLLKRKRDTAVHGGELQRSHVTLHDYAQDWIARYQGTGRRGFREETRDEYRGLLNKYALHYFKSSQLLVDRGALQIAQLIGWLVKQPNGRKGTLSDKAVRNALGRSQPVSRRPGGRVLSRRIQRQEPPYRTGRGSRRTTSCRDRSRPERWRWLCRWFTLTTG